LVDLLASHPDEIMFCSDDKHPNDLTYGHINQLIIRAMKKGYDFIDIIRACTYVPVKHYNLEVGLLQVGDAADFIIIDNLFDFNILSTFIDGHKVAENGKTLINSVEEDCPNIFKANIVLSSDLEIPFENKEIKVIKALEGQLITEKMMVFPKHDHKFILSDTERDILKIVVLNRYEISKPSVAYINGFGFKNGAIASTVAHDSHNIIAVGTNDNDIAEAINLLINSKGGISVVNDKTKYHLPLPVAGLMSNEDGFEVAHKYEFIDQKAKELGSVLQAPFMTLSFMALLVIPELKISDKGLFDGNIFEFTSL
jgi:adenine deaminase